MLTSKFGIEIEFTGITRVQAAQVAAGVLGGTRQAYGEEVIAPDGRVWKFVYDASISPQKKVDGRKVHATSDYHVELVSPILTYAGDMETLQKLVRALREAGAFPNSSAGIHIHLDGAAHTAKSLRNFVNIIASKNDLFYKALQIKPDRMRFCKKMDEVLVKKMKERRPRTLEAIKRIWYEGYGGFSSGHYHESRYHFLNLHSFFTGHHTVELRGFNSTLHAGVIRSYVMMALALNHQALSQASASPRKPQTDNERFAMRTYLVRIGFVGDEFKNCREHLCKHLSGNAAWRFRTAA